VDEEKVKKKMKDGWIKSWMMIEVLATSEEATKEALKHHIERMGNENKTLLIKTDFQDVQEIEKPVPQVEKGYSQVVELELLTETFDKLMFLTMNYGPSAVEILEPNNIKMDMGEAQGIINSIASMIHKFAAAGIGGVVINR
jgi:transcription antitermination factor NusG